MDRELPDMSLHALLLDYFITYCCLTT